MTCYRPISARRTEGGKISLSKGDLDRPLSLPCGKCVGCRSAHARSWAIRCVHEARLHDRSCFVTLTYAPENLPRGGSLDVRDWQLFAKRVRERIGKFRFFQCGEYGERTFRPHHHAVMFGIDFDRKTWKLYQRRPGGDLYTSSLLEEIWSKGFCTIGALTIESAAYVARYAMKKCARSAENTEFYRRVDPVTGEEFYVDREFLTMSRRPGIGRGFYEAFRSDMFPADRCVVDGKCVAVPKYYYSLLEKDDPGLYLSLKAKRQSSVVKQNVAAGDVKRTVRKTLERLPRHLARAASLGVAVEGSENSSERLVVKEAVDLSKMKTFSKREL